VGNHGAKGRAGLSMPALLLCKSEDMLFRKQQRALVACLVFGGAPFVGAMPVHTDVVLQPGKFHEECFRLAPQQRIQYNFKLDRPGEFNVHYHAGKEIIYPIRSVSVSEQKGDFVAPIAQEYCLMWTGVRDGTTRLGYESVVVEPGLTKQ
jgi:hypothetical protein